MSKCSYSVNKIKKQLIKMSKCSYSVNKIKNLTHLKDIDPLSIKTCICWAKEKERVGQVGMLHRVKEREQQIMTSPISSYPH